MRETILTIIGVIIVLCIIFSGQYFLRCWMHDGSYPSSALPYVYERMSDKTNVTFISKSFTYEDGMYFYVIDSDDVWWRVEKSYVYNNIIINKSYDLRYDDFHHMRPSSSDNIWEIKENKTVNYV